MSEWAWLTLLALSFQLSAGATETSSADIIMPFFMEDTTVISLPVTTLPNPLQSCDSTWLGPDCSSSEAGLSTSILKATTSLMASQRLGTVEQTTAPLTLIQTSPTPTPQPPGSGSGMDQGLFPSPTPVSLPSTYILITIHQLTRQDYESFRQNITEVLKHVVAGYVPVLTVDEEQSIPNRTVLQLYFTTLAGMADDNATVQAFHQLRNNRALIMQLRVFLQEFDLQLQRETPTTSPPTTPTPPLPWWNWLIIGISGAIAFSACLLLYFACYCRYLSLYRKKKQGEKERLLGGEEPDGEAMEMERIQEREQRVKKVSRISFRSRAQVRSRPLTVEELQYSLMNPAALYAEYESIPSNMVTMAEVPPGAEEKNRYKDVLPNAPTRVSLFLKFGVANSDYINANFIRGYHDAPKVYIATQGPLYWTAADFWRMVWEQRSSSIVMATNLEEKGLVKCARYWPDTSMSQSTVYEDLEVVTRSRTTTQDFTTTTFLLRHREKMVSREVVHFMFRSWPDHGVPLTTRPVLDFLLHARKHMRDMPGPTVVHCSAGIGRTGVFIGADIGMQQLEETGEVDVLRIVSVMRQDRGGMVQTKEQYLFLHQILLDYSHYLDQLRNPYLHHHHRRRLQTTKEEEEEEEETESGVASGDSQTALT